MELAKQATLNSQDIAIQDQLVLETDHANKKIQTNQDIVKTDNVMEADHATPTMTVSLDIVAIIRFVIILQPQLPYHMDIPLKQLTQRNLIFVQARLIQLANVFII